MSAAPLSRHAAARWQRWYDNLDNAGIAAALRGWVAWRQEQIALHPTYADAITDCYAGLTAWLRQEAQRRLAPKPRGRSMTTAELLARFNDRLRPTGPDRWRTSCPWHEDAHPSLVVFADGHVHCFSCGAHHPVDALAAAWRKLVAA